MENERTYHIIRNGVKEEVSASALNKIDESTDDNYELDMEWYLANGAITLEDFKNAHPLTLPSEQYHPNSKITLQEALDKGHMLLEDFDKELRTGSNE